jgi:hypothetical protein
MTETKIYLDIPHTIKNRSEINSAQFDSDKKLWYVFNESLLPKYKRVYLNAGFCFEDVLKANGGCWDVETKCWYVINESQLLKFFDKVDPNDSSRFREEIKINTCFDVETNSCIHRRRSLFDWFGETYKKIV